VTEEGFQAKVLTHMGEQTAEMRNIRGWMETLDGKVDEVRTGKAPVCQQHSEDIRELQKAKTNGNGQMKADARRQGLFTSIATIIAMAIMLAVQWLAQRFGWHVGGSSQ
jgi:hypothetical protein